MLLLIFTFQGVIAQAPKSLSWTGTLYSITQLTLSCTGPAGKECPEHVARNFAFYTNLIFQNKQPLSAADYAEMNLSAPLSNVYLTINEFPSELDIQSVSEAYNMSVTAENITITAQTPMAAARAFSTMMQLTTQVENKSVTRDAARHFVIESASVQDYPSMQWRHYNADACAHYMTVADIERILDAASIQKLNVLLLTLGCAYSFPLKYKQKPAYKLVYGAYTPYHYYTHEHMLHLQRYAQERGVVLVPEIRMPGQTFSWRFADPELVANCPKQIEANPNNAVLNPFFPKLQNYLDAIIADTVAMFFPTELKIRPHIHVGGQQPSFECWKEDQTIQSKVLLNAGMSYAKLWADFQTMVNQAATRASKKLVLLVDEASVQNGNDHLNSSIIHFTTSSQRRKAADKNLKSITSNQANLALMHPNGGHHYFWQETWFDMQRIDFGEGLEANLSLGGGIQQPSFNCYSRSCEQHSFDRAFGVADKLWAGGNGWGDARRMEKLEQYFSQAGLGYGPLDIGAPFPGYPKV